MDYNFSIDNEDEDYVLINPLLNYKIEQYTENYVNDENPEEIILPFHTTDLIRSIKYSYKTRQEIYEQFKIDMLRTRIYYNDKNTIINHNQLYNRLLNNTYIKHNINDLLVCLTQSVFFWPYKMIYHKYCCHTEMLHLGEISYPKKKKYDELYDKIKKTTVNNLNKLNKLNKPNKPNKLKEVSYDIEVQLTNYVNDNNNIIYIDKKNLSQIIIYKKLRIFKIDINGNDETLHVKTIELHISLEDEISLLKIY